MAERIRGIIKWFNGDKGYGFISCENGENVFVHVSAIQLGGFQSMLEGQKVEFSLGKGHRRLQAVKVSLIG